MGTGPSTLKDEILIQFEVQYPNCKNMNVTRHDYRTFDVSLDIEHTGYIETFTVRLCYNRKVDEELPDELPVYEALPNSVFYCILSVPMFYGSVERYKFLKEIMGNGTLFVIRRNDLLSSNLLVQETRAFESYFDVKPMTDSIYRLSEITYDNSQDGDRTRRKPLLIPGFKF